MFHPELTAVTSEIQRVIDMCCRTNLPTRVAEEMQRLKGYLDWLDPTDINFANVGRFNQMKITRYWAKFNDLYGGLESVIAALQEKCVVLQNTIVTLENTHQKTGVILGNLNVGTNAPDPVNDMEYAQQMAVTLQSVNMLNNLIGEYKTCYEYVTKVQNLTVTTFQQAISIARMQQDFGTFDYRLYTQNYRAVREMLEN